MCRLMCNVVQLCLAANNILLMRKMVGHLLGLRHAPLSLRWGGLRDEPKERLRGRLAIA